MFYLLLIQLLMYTNTNAYAMCLNGALAQVRGRKKEHQFAHGLY